MDIDRYFKDSAKKDPSWAAAKQIVEKQLSIPSNLINLIRNGWIGILEIPDVVRLLGFTSLNGACLLNAAGMPTDGSRPSAASLEQAVLALGSRYAVAVLAINTTVRNILKAKPSFGWRKLFENMMTEIEIGYTFGVRAGEIGLEGGIVAGFAKNAGLGLLLAHNTAAYRKYQETINKHGRIGSKLVLGLFGCEPYQVSALAMQSLGFGATAAFGTLCGLAELNTVHIDLGDDVMCWRAAFQWIEALRAGRNYPAEMLTRNHFPALKPPKEAGAKNPVLEVLHTEVARVRRDGSNWCWHLPRPDYERTRQAFGL